MSTNKIFIDPDTLAPHVEELKSRGLTVVFANGCFELLHVGHVRYLQAARALGDVLIVAVNSDSSMALIKPDRKPVIPDVERYELLAAFEMVDYVVPPGVRIADADRVRLGAHLAPGTTVMHEGFVNFNAGSIGAAMIGRKHRLGFISRHPIV